MEEETITTEDETTVVDEGSEVGDAAEEGDFEEEELVRYKANPETTESINRMMALVDETQGSQHLLDYEILHEKLNIEFKKIFDNCTMEGEAHEALHEFMLPMKKYFEGIGSDDLITCQESLNSLERYLSTYEYKFE